MEVRAHCALFLRPGISGRRGCETVSFHQRPASAGSDGSWLAPKQNGRHGMIVWFNVYLFCWKSSSKYIAKVHKNKTLCKIFFGIISYKYRRNGVADRKECLNDG
jgi:hypothetical protein